MMLLYIDPMLGKKNADNHYLCTFRVDHILVLHIF